MQGGNCQKRAIALGGIFFIILGVLKISAKALSIKEQMIVLYFPQNKSFCFSKVTVKRMKRKTTDWEKIFAKNRLEKRAVFIICKELLVFSNKRTNISGLAKVLNTSTRRKWKWKSLSPVWLFMTPWTIVPQAPLSVEFTTAEYWRDSHSGSYEGSLPQWSMQRNRGKQ